jgi:high-affinity Fe2+/Pb2+ permease
LIHGNSRSIADRCHCRLVGRVDRSWCRLRPLGNIVIGIIGALVAGWLLPRLGVSLGVGAIRDIINATIGAVIVLVILSLIRR